MANSGTRGRTKKMGENENTNGLSRQYFPKGTYCRKITQSFHHLKKLRRFYSMVMISGISC
jgi:hypothetical protein